MRYLALLALSLAIPPLSADWKVTTVSSNEQGRSSQTEYYKSGLRRTENQHYVSVLDLTARRYTVWDLEKREYFIQRLHQGQQASESGTPILIDVETTDTGERRTMFGREARHQITVERRGDSESRTDGWYIDSETLPSELRKPGFTMLVTSHQRQPLKINRHGVERKGIPVLATVTTSSTKNTMEVTELSEGQLDPAIFQPPVGFRRVYAGYDFAQLSWPDRVWDWVQDRLGLP